MSNAGRKHLRTCPLCEAMCGLEVTVRGGRVTKIRPDSDDVWSRGYVCPKGTTLGQLHHDPDRLRAPLLRGEDGFREVSWEEAFAEVERRLHSVIAKHGASAVSSYVGNPNAHNFSLSRYIAAYIAMSGIPSIYSAGTVDQWPKNVAVSLLYGDMWRIPVPDIDRTDYFLVMGANPHASQGSLLAAPDLLGRMDAVRDRGGKVVVVDPRRTGTAERADEWIPIQPGTDAALLMAMVQVLFAEGLVDLAHLEDATNGVAEVEILCADFTPESVAETCRIPADTIRRLARELAAAPSAAVYGRIGTCNQEFGTLASWLVEVVNVLTGNLDKPGGPMFANPIAWSFVNLPNPEFADGFEFGRWRSRVRGAPEVLGQVPVSCLAEEIATPGKGQIRALITIAGNPVISAPDSEKLDLALPSLDCMISVDNYLNETTRHAHVILPGLSPLEQPHYDELLWTWAVRNAGNYSSAIFPPEAGRPAEWEILLKLSGIAAGQKASEVDPLLLDNLFFAGLVATLTAQPGFPIEGRDPAEIVAQSGEPGPERLLELAIRTGPYGDAYGSKPDGLTLENVKAHEHGIDMGPLQPRLAEVLRTKSGKIELAPPYITADLARLRHRLGRASDGLVLVSRRDVRSNNSWMHNVPKLVAGKDRCTLLVNPEDAQRIGLTAAGSARVTSEAGSVMAPVEITDSMMPGIVCLPHGWGHDRQGARLSVASAHPGVNNNLLAPGDLVDVISGNAVVNGIPVVVTPA